MLYACIDFIITGPESSCLRFQLDYGCEHTPRDHSAPKTLSCQSAPRQLRSNGEFTVDGVPQLSVRSALSLCSLTGLRDGGHFLGPPESTKPRYADEWASLDIRRTTQLWID
eukprot:gene27329-biopygen8784